MSVSEFAMLLHYSSV